MGCSGHAIDKPSLETEGPRKRIELSGEGRGLCAAGFCSHKWNRKTKWCISLSLKGKSSSSLLPKGTGSLQVIHPDLRLSDGPISTQVTSPKRKDSFGSGAFSIFF